MREFKGEWIVSERGSVFREVTSSAGQIAIITGDDKIENAKLIAAAPELLKALQDLVNQVGNEHVSEFMGEFLEQSNNAINKALGE